MLRSNQLSYEITDVGSWSFVSSNEPVKNGCEVIYEIFHILNCGFEVEYVLIWLTGLRGSGIRGLVFSPLLYFCSHEYVFKGASFSV